MSFFLSSLLKLTWFMQLFNACQISEKVKPHPVVVNVLSTVEGVIPKWKIVPTKDVIDSAFKDPAKRERVSALSLPSFLRMLRTLSS